MKGEKRGQATLFIIMGIVILIGVGFFLSNSQEIATSTSGESATRTTDVVPTMGAPMYEQVKLCVEDLTKEGIKQLAQHGGYIDPKNKGYELDENVITEELKMFPQQPTRSQALEFVPESGINIAYWHYVDGDCSHKYNCVYESQQPFITDEDDPEFSVETQLGNYVKFNLETCVDSFKDLEDAGYEIEKGDILVDVDVNRRDVVAFVEWPLKFSIDGSEVELMQFTGKHDVNLVGILNYAGQIASFQRSQLFFEQNTMEIINAFSGLEGDKLPPTTGISDKLADRKFWIRSQVADKVQTLLTNYIPMMKVSNAINNQLVVPPTAYSDAMYRRFIMPVHVDEFEDTQESANEKLDYFVPYEVKFNYLSLWPIDLDIRGSGSNGEFIGPQVTSPGMNIMKFFETANYEFYYDVSYPVLVEIYDAEAFGGEGLKLSYALEVNVVHNHLNFNRIVTADGAELGRSAGGGTMLCNYNQRASEPLRIETYDALTGEALDKVSINYGCGQLCDLEYTQLETDSPNPKAMTEVRLPTCMGGQLYGIKKDYAGVMVDFDAQEGVVYDETIEMNMYPLHNLNVDVRKFMNRPIGWEYDGPDKHIWDVDPTPRQLFDNELAFIIVERDIESPFEEDVPNIVIFNTSLDEPVQVRVSPGQYEVSIITMENRPVTRVPGRFWCRSDIHEENCNLYNYSLPSQMGGGYGALNMVTYGLHNVPCQSAITTGIIEDIQIMCKDCRTLDTCSWVEDILINKTMFKGEISYQWTVTEDVYNFNTVTFNTITSPDGYDVAEDGMTTDMTFEDLGLIGKGEELAAQYPTFTRASLSNRVQLP